MVCQFLLYNKVNPVIHTHMSPYLFPLASPSLPPSLSHPYRWSQTTKLISLCYAAASHQLSILRLVVYICPCHSHFVTAYPSPSPYPQVHSLVGLCLYSRLTPRLISVVQQTASVLHIYMSFFVFFSIMVYTITIFHIVPRALQQDLVVYPFCI